MAIALSNPAGTSIAEVDATAKALRVSPRPVEALSWGSHAASSGALSGLAAGAPVYALRNLAANPLLVQRISIAFVLTTAFSASQLVDFGLMVARQFTASDTGGTAIALSGTTNGKHRSSLSNLTSIDARIAATAALTAGTRTLDAVPMAIMPGFAAGLANGAVIPFGNLFSEDTGDYPLILVQNEGFEIQAVSAFGSGGAGRLYVGVELAEVASF